MIELLEGETLETYVERRIKEIFYDLAEILANTEMDEEIAADIPFQLFVKAQMLLSAWYNIAAN